MCNLDVVFFSSLRGSVVYEGFFFEKHEERYYTPWKFNIAPKNRLSQRESSLATIIFQGLC